MQITTNFPDKFYEEEEKTLVVSKDTKRLWAVLLDLLIEFDGVCKKHGIKYMIDGGTLLGAARHGGFIPWDDDIDVIMLREEYEKLNKIASREFNEPYFWQTSETDVDHGRGFARLRNSSTTYIPRFEMSGQCSMFRHNQGVLIDIFICDNVPDDAQSKSVFLKKLSKLHSRAWGLRMAGHCPLRLGLLTRLPDFVRKLSYHILTALRGRDASQDLVQQLCLVAQEFSGLTTKYVSHLTFCPVEGNRQCIMVPRHIFEDMGEIEFEGYKFPATKYWDEYLTIVYGNWHKHVIATNTPGGIFIDLDNPYTRYLSKE